MNADRTFPAEEVPAEDIKAIDGTNLATPNGINLPNNKDMTPANHKFINDAIQGDTKLKNLEDRQNVKRQPKISII